MRRLHSKNFPSSLSCRTLLLLVIASLAVGACTPQYSRYDWSGFVSKSETLRFLAAASCTAPDFVNPVAADATFFKISSLEPVKREPWTYTAELVGEDRIRRGRFLVSQWWTAAGVKGAPWTVTKDAAFCNVLAEVPASRNGTRPYYVEPE